MVIQDTQPIIYNVAHFKHKTNLLIDTVLWCLIAFSELEVLPPILVYASYAYLLVYMFIMWNPII